MPSNPLKPSKAKASHRAWHAQRPGKHPSRFSGIKSARSPEGTCATSYEFNSDRSIPRANLLTGLGVDETFSRTDASGPRHLLTDALGSTLALTDGAGAVQTSYSYEPYGKTTVSGTASSNSFEYTGRENDSTGLYFYRARYYNPGLQRFVSEDPIGLAAGPNVYGYVGGNPVSYRDPRGLQKTWQDMVGPNYNDAPYPPDWPITSQEKTPNTGAPGEWHTNPGSGQERLYGPDGRPAVDIDWDHDHGQGRPHPHNWGPGGREVPEGGFSPWPRGRTNPAQCPR